MDLAFADAWYVRSRKTKATIGALELRVLQKANLQPRSAAPSAKLKTPRAVRDREPVQRQGAADTEQILQIQSNGKLLQHCVWALIDDATALRTKYW